MDSSHDGLDGHSTGASHNALASSCSWKHLTDSFMPPDNYCSKEQSLELEVRWDHISGAEIYLNCIISKILPIESIWEPLGLFNGKLY